MNGLLNESVMCGVFNISDSIQIVFRIMAISSLWETFFA